MTAIWTRLVTWYATRSASTWLLGIGLTLAFSLFWYVDELRDFKKLCKQAQSDQLRYGQIVKKYEDAVKEKQDENIEIIEDSDHSCLDVDIAELLNSPMDGD